MFVHILIDMPVPLVRGCIRNTRCYNKSQIFNGPLFNRERKNMRLLLVEDDPIQLKYLKILIEDNFPDISVTTSGTYKEAMNIIDTAAYIDIFVLDIMLTDTEDDPDGVSLGVHIKELTKYTNTPVIFITSYESRIYEAVNDVHCYSFIPKPVDESLLMDTIDSLARQNTKKNDNIILRTENGIAVPIDPNKIVYISSIKGVIKIKTEDDCISSSTWRLSRLMPTLPGYMLRCHKCYIVNLNHVTNVDYTTRMCHTDAIENGNVISLPMGRVYISEIREAFNDKRRIR